MIYGPFRIRDILAMIWWGLTHPEPARPITELLPRLPETKAETQKLPPATLVIQGPDHDYREAEMRATTAILCERPGSRATLHHDMFPYEEPGKGFDIVEGMKLTRVNVLLVQRRV